jgi:hypothetical protein
MNDPFWIDKPEILLKCDIIPNENMTINERLNTLTRLLILICIFLYIIEYKYVYIIFIIGILLIFLLRKKYNTDGKKIENFTPRRGNHDVCKNCGLDSHLAYINSKYETTPINQYSHDNYSDRSYTHAHYKVIPSDVPAPYRDVWQNESRWCNEFTQYPTSYTIISDDNGFNNIPTRKCFQENTFWIENNSSCNGNTINKKYSAMPAIQSAFMTDSLEYRNNIMGDYIDQIERTRQHNCVDFKPGRKTF